MKHNKTLKDLNLLDRFLFEEAADDPEFMELVLEIILEKEIVLKHLPQTEKENHAALWSRQVKLDVWSMDIEDSIYDVEVQNRNTGSLLKRTRLYHGLIDSKLFTPGAVDYNSLNDVFVIIIMPFDLFGRGLFRLSFLKTCLEIPELEMPDGSIRIFLSTRGRDFSGVSDELISLLEYFEHTTAAAASKSQSDRILRLQEKVEAIRANEEVGVKLMNAWEEKIYEREDGRREGRQEERKNLISKLKEKLSDEEIAELTGIPIADI